MCVRVWLLVEGMWGRGGWVWDAHDGDRFGEVVVVDLVAESFFFAQVLSMNCSVWIQNLPKNVGV